MNDQRFLITGLNSLIGWHLFLKVSPDYPTFGTYRKPHPELERPYFYRIDMDDYGSIHNLFQEINPHYVIHTRAICDLDICEQFPEMANQINIQGTHKVIEAARGLPELKKFIFTSTDHVFSGSRGNYGPEEIPEPKHIYGKTKRIAEIFVQESGLPHLIIRPGLVIGKSFQGNKGPRDFLFSRIKANKPTHLFTDEWRSPIRAELLAEQILNLCLSDERGVFHLAGAEAYNRYELGQMLAHEEGLSIHQIHPRLRAEDEWASIRPHNLTLKSAPIAIFSTP